MEATSTEKRIDELSDRVGRFEGRFERFEDKVDACFDKLEDRLRGGDARADAGLRRIDERFVTKEEFKASNASIAARFDKLEGRLDNWGKLMGGGVVTIAVAVVLKVFGV
jgi:hypothetical protein